ncbi:DUF4913 domain-containing protein [Nocardia sp. XZ_19_385]|uniref:DUF4913 domain-containing protein n=1 Tax=Nocardia sp. XZ_19_385 TaxID=2769488 RepID=UPI00188FE041|nr:DUF4913 domain-containing protein [Nocardia sp. XZ_19_385]
MSGPTPTTPTPSISSPKKAPQPPKYRDFIEFTHKWLLPGVNVRLAESQRENTFTWCPQWWCHRPVAVRIAHLHSAFEASRRAKGGNALSSFLLNHHDPQLRVILDAANGPLHRCTRTQHTALASLPADPVPPGWFPPPGKPATDTTDAEKKPPPMFARWYDWVEQWLLPVTAVRITSNSREGTYSWCRQWWRHHEVCVRLAAVHAVFEAARRAEDKAAMSTLFVRHIDPHLRSILDAANGPLHRCSPTQHIDLAGLVGAPVPLAWFGVPGERTPIERLGFGPDFRALGSALGGDRS